MRMTGNKFKLVHGVTSVSVQPLKFVCCLWAHCTIST